MRTGILLMAYGAPRRLDQVDAYYTHIRGGSPPPVALLDQLLGRYRAIGGSSPLSGIVERQRAALASERARRGHVHRGARRRRRGRAQGAAPGVIAPLPLGSVRPTRYVFDRAPMLVYWEMTRACRLACRHCRAEAVLQRSDRELTTAEAERLLDQITAFGPRLPHLVLTGGDPLRRPDLVHLVREATARGIGTSVSPSATVDLTPTLIDELCWAGVRSMSLSLDGSTAERHDAFRGVAGTFATTLAAARWIREAGIPLQINTLVTSETVDDLPAIHELLIGLDIMRWSLFFLIGVGRGAALREVTPARSERLFRWLLDLEAASPFPIKTTEATHYRRVAATRMRRAGVDREAIERSSVGRGFGVRDGNGIAFVAFDGTIHPSGFLPIPCGNVRTSPLSEVYRRHPLFAALRDARAFKGKCGACPFALICGGSRARAYARSGDPLESDPLCPYVPPRRAPAWETLA